MLRLRPRRLIIHAANAATASPPTILRRHRGASMRQLRTEVVCCVLRQQQRRYIGGTPSSPSSSSSSPSSTPPPSSSTLNSSSSSSPSSQEQQQQQQQKEQTTQHGSSSSHHHPQKEAPMPCMAAPTNDDTPGCVMCNVSLIAIGVIVSVAHVVYDYWWHFHSGHYVPEAEEEEKEVEGVGSSSDSGKVSNTDRKVEEEDENAGELVGSSSNTPAAAAPAHVSYNSDHHTANHTKRLYEWTMEAGIRDLIAFLSSNNNNTHTHTQQPAVAKSWTPSSPLPKLHFIEEFNTFPSSSSSSAPSGAGSSPIKQQQQEGESAHHQTHHRSFPQSAIRLLRLNEKYCGEIETMRIVSYHPPPPPPPPHQHTNTTTTTTNIIDQGGGGKDKDTTGVRKTEINTNTNTNTNTINNNATDMSMASLMRAVLTTPSLRRQWDKNYKMFQIVHRAEHQEQQGVPEASRRHPTSPDPTSINDDDERRSSSSSGRPGGSRDDDHHSYDSVRDISGFLPWLSHIVFKNNNNNNTTTTTTRWRTSICDHLWACHRTCPPFVDKFGFSPWFFMYELLVLRHECCEFNPNNINNINSNRNRNSAYQLLYRSIPPPGAEVEATAHRHCKNGNTNSLNKAGEGGKQHNDELHTNNSQTQLLTLKELQQEYGKHSSLDKDSLCHMHRQEILLIPLNRATVEAEPIPTRTSKSSPSSSTSITAASNTNTDTDTDTGSINNKGHQVSLLTRLVDLCARPETVDPGFDLVGAVKQAEAEAAAAGLVAVDDDERRSRCADVDVDNDNGDGGVLMVMTSTNYIPTPRVVPMWAQLFLASKVTEDAAKQLTKAAHDYGQGKILVQQAPPQPATTTTTSSGSASSSSSSLQHITASRGTTGGADIDDGHHQSRADEGNNKGGDSWWRKVVDSVRFGARRPIASTTTTSVAAGGGTAEQTEQPRKES